MIFASQHTTITRCVLTRCLENVSTTWKGYHNLIPKLVHKRTPPQRYPTWAIGGAVGMYMQLMPVFIAGSLLSTFGISNNL